MTELPVWTIDPESGEWLFYVPGLPSFLDTLHTLSTGDAAWVVADAEVDLPLP